VKDQHIDAILNLLDHLPTAPMTRLARGASIYFESGISAAIEMDRAAEGPIQAAQAMIAGLWVAADRFEEAHEIAQGLPDEWGAWWHAILHRREPDASNALYWYRRVKAPPEVWKDLGRRAAQALGSEPVTGLEPLAGAIRKSGNWEPVPFVRAVEAGQSGGLAADAVGKLAELQRLEWRAWFDACRAAATGG